MSEFDSIGMTAESVGRLVKVDIVGTAIERPQRGDASAATAYNGNLLPGEAFSWGGHGT